MLKTNLSLCACVALTTACGIKTKQEDKKAQTSTEDVTAAASGSFKLTVPELQLDVSAAGTAAKKISKVRIVIEGTENFKFDEKFNYEPGKEIQIEKIKAGPAYVKVEVLDEGGTVVKKGDAKVEVKAGEVVKAQIQLQSENGGVNVVIIDNSKLQVRKFAGYVDTSKTNSCESFATFPNNFPVKQLLRISSVYLEHKDADNYEVIADVTSGYFACSTLKLDVKLQNSLLLVQASATRTVQLGKSCSQNSGQTGVKFPIQLKEIPSAMIIKDDRTYCPILAYQAEFDACVLESEKNPSEAIGCQPTPNCKYGSSSKYVLVKSSRAPRSCAVTVEL